MLRPLFYILFNGASQSSLLANSLAERYRLTTWCQANCLPQSRVCGPRSSRTVGPARSLYDCV